MILQNHLGKSKSKIQLQAHLQKLFIACNLIHIQKCKSSLNTQDQENMIIYNIFQNPGYLMLVSTYKAYLNADFVSQEQATKYKTAMQHLIHTRILKKTNCKRFITFTKSGFSIGQTVYIQENTSPTRLDTARKRMDDALLFNYVTPFETEGFQRHDTVGDGNCLFRSILQCFGLSPLMYMVLRLLSCYNIKLNHTLFRNKFNAMVRHNVAGISVTEATDGPMMNFDQWLKDNEQDGFFDNFGELHLISIMYMFNIQIEILVPEKNTITNLRKYPTDVLADHYLSAVTILEDEAQQYQCIRLANFCDHYEAIIPYHHQHAFNLNKSLADSHVINKMEEIYRNKYNEGKGFKRVPIQHILQKLDLPLNFEMNEQQCRTLQSGYYRMLLKYAYPWVSAPPHNHIISLFGKYYPKLSDNPSTSHLIYTIDTATHSPTSSPPIHSSTIDTATQSSISIHPTQLPIVSHPIQSPILSHPVQLPIGSHPTQSPIVSHPTQSPIVSLNVFQDVQTSRSPSPSPQNGWNKSPTSSQSQLNQSPFPSQTELNELPSSSQIQLNQSPLPSQVSSNQILAELDELSTIISGTVDVNVNDGGSDEDMDLNYEAEVDTGDDQSEDEPPSNNPFLSSLKPKSIRTVQSIYIIPRIQHDIHLSLAFFFAGKVRQNVQI